MILKGDEKVHVGRLSTLITLALTVGLSSPATGQQKIYWTEAGAGKIRRADLDGSNIQDLVTTGLTSPAGIALDLSAGKMYWADSGAGKIQRADLDGSNVEDLVSGLSKPYGIALDLGAGQMYWTNVGQSGQADGTIQRANLDGSNVENFVLIPGLVDPRGIALDPASFRMYWADSGTGKIQRAFMGGILVEDVFAPGNAMYSPFQVALDVAGGKLYWTAFFFEFGVVDRANLDGSNFEPFINTSTGLAGPPIEGLALDLSVGKLYWSQWGGTIHRIDLDRANYEVLITSSSTALGIALDLREPIPTVSVWGMIVLTLLMLTAGSIVITRGSTGGLRGVKYAARNGRY